MAAALQEESFYTLLASDAALANYLRDNPAAAAAMGVPQHIVAQFAPARPSRYPAPVSGISSTSGTGSGTSNPAVSSDGSATPGIFTAMQQRLNAMAAKFRRNRATQSSTATSSTPSRGSWFSRGPAYQGLATEETADSSSRDFVPASRADRVRVASQRDDAASGGDIELITHSSHTGAASVPSAARQGTQKEDIRKPDTSTAFAIADEDDEEESETVGLTSHRRV